MKTVKWCCVISLVLSASAATAQQKPQPQQQPAQQQEDSLAAAARRARELKKDQSKAPKVWDNDNLPTNTSGVNVVGHVSPATENAANSSAGGQVAPGPAESPEKTASEKAALTAEIAAAKEHLQDLKTDLDILQRKNALDQRTYYGKPNFAADKDGAAKLNSEQDEIDAKQEEVAAAQKKIDDLQAKLDASK